MKLLKPPAVYVSDRVRADERCNARVEQLMTRVECDNIIEVTDDDIARLLEEKGWDQSRRESGRRKDGDPPLLLNRFRWDEAEQEAVRRQRGDDYSTLHFFGLYPFGFRDRGPQLEKANIVCQSAWEIHSARGCLFKCDYCMYEDFVMLMMDLEQWSEHLEQLIDDNPNQSLYKYDSFSDILTFEPEYGASQLLVPMFARKPNAYLMHYTKSDNVDHLLELDHNGHTMVCWSLSAFTQSRLIDRDSATTEQRIEAGRKCQAAGYPVRFRFSPMVPVKNWQQELADTVKLLLSKVNPEVISIQTLSRFPDYDIVERVMQTDLMDERFLEAMASRPDDVRGRVYGPIPHALRREMYEFMIERIREIDPGVPVSLCLESSDMWDDLEETMGLDRKLYPCCCGPTCTPGNPVLARLG